MRKTYSIFLFAGFIVFVGSLLGLDAAIAKPQPTWQSIFWNWLSQEPKDRGGGRNSGGRPGDPVCLITPINNAEVWTTQPLFVWQGGYRVTGIRPKGNASLPWEAAGTVQTQAGKHSSYVSKTLAPGKDYEWGLFVDQNRLSPIKPITFRVMDGSQRTTIAKDLQTLETRLKAQNASEEAIALARTNYFAEKGLRADALQEIYSVKQLSTELKQVRQDIEKEVCQSEK